MFAGLQRAGLRAGKGLLRSRTFKAAPKLTRSVTIGASDAGAERFDFARGFKGHKIDDLPEAHAYTTKEEMLEFYELMVFYRRFEIVADTLYKQRQIRGFCHLYDGQEAVVIGMDAAIDKKDSVITSYRDHCHQMIRGDTPESVMAELLGKSGGCSRGKGGSMHMYHPDGAFYGGNGIVGAQVPLGAGLAFAHKYKKDGGCALAFYGDGAANQGQLFEAANMAALWKLPMIFVCENNEYGMGTSIARASGSATFYTRGDFIPGLWADGMDVLASKKAFDYCASYVKSGKGPIFLEMSTYRYHGHSMSDPGISYRSRDEVDAVRRERDPIDGVKNRILEKEWATPAELKKIDKAQRKRVDAAVKWAQESPDLPFEEITNDIYTETPPPYIRMVDPADSIRHGGRY
jgi:pyruvate dehydrogenase E1 component alpha subunit